jgi:hypothetical protein
VPLRALATFSAFHAAWIVATWHGDLVLTLLAVATAIAAGISLARPQLAAVSLAVFVLAMAYHAPNVPNHAFLVASMLVITIVFAPNAERGLPVLGSIVLGWAGAQKLLAGTWTQGQMLAFEVAHEGRFRTTLGWLASDAEIAAWRESGVFLASWPLTIVGWLVCLAELAVAVAIAVPRTRRLAALAGTVLCAGFAIVARELTFAMALFALFGFVASPNVFARGWPFVAAVLWSIALASRFSGIGGVH